MTTRLRRAAAIAPALGLLLMAACGTDTGPPGAGLTNGPPPGAGEKAAMRTDLPNAPTPDTGEALGRTGDVSPSGGDAARGGDAVAPKAKPGDDKDEARATPPAVEGGSPGPAAGTRPAEPIKDGTPRSHR